MRRRFTVALRRGLTAVAWTWSAAVLHAAPPGDLDAYVHRAMETSGAPGLSLAISEDGTTTVARGYGVRRMGQSKRVDDRTLFPIGSNTKAFTATALAMLVDEGKLAWDDKVVAHLPGFQMQDPYVTGEMTIRDLLVHNSGLSLGQGDLMLIRTSYTRRDVVARLRHLELTGGFRAGYAYDNVLYTAAGVLIEEVSGQSWEDFIKDRIFSPLEMDDSTPSYADVGRWANRGWQHARLDGRIRGVGPIKPLEEVYPVSEPAVPAGGINASARDMAKWLSVHLRKGKLPDGTSLFSKTQATTLWNPVTLQPVGPRNGPLGETQPQFRAYALGFGIADYQGHKIVQHGGGWFGGVSMVVWIPEKGVGFALMTNSEEVGALSAIRLKLLDHYLGAPAVDWIEPAHEDRQTRIQQAIDYLDTQDRRELPVGPPSLPLSAYAGTYQDPWLGTVTIREAADGLAISFDPLPGISGALEHVRHDTFRTRLRDPSFEDAYATFSLTPEGGIERITMKAVSPLADFSFDYHDLRLKPVPPRTGEAPG